jgi:hypothetical protein
LNGGDPGPVIDQAGGVDAPDARCEVPARRRAIRRSERSSRSRKHTHTAGRQVTIVIASAIYIYVAQSDVIENTSVTDIGAVR